MNPDPDPVLTGSGSEAGSESGSGSGLFSEVGSGSGPNRSGSATLFYSPTKVSARQISRLSLQRVLDSPCSLEPAAGPDIPADPDAVPVLLGLDVILVCLRCRHPANQ